MIKRKINLILVVALVLLLILTSCEADRIDPDVLESKEIALEKTSIKLDPLQKEEVFIGINNKDTEKRKFSVFISCETEDCEENVITQFFPSLELEPGQKIAMPIMIYAQEGSKKGIYSFRISVKKGDLVIGEETLNVEVLNTVEEKKKELIETVSGN